MGKVIGGEFAINPNLLKNIGMNDLQQKQLDYSSGRCALYAILKDAEDEYVLSGKKIMIPDYLCDCISTTILDAGWTFSFYHVDLFLQPDKEQILQLIQDGYKTLLLIDYFGFAEYDALIEDIKNACLDVCIILDSVQAFYRYGKNKKVDYEFTSYRKWFATPDGALARKKNDKEICKVYLSNNTFSDFKVAGNLLKSFDEYLSDEPALELLKKGEELLDDNYLCQASKIAGYLIEQTDTSSQAAKRMKNARILHDELTKLEIKHIFAENAIPFFVPILLDNRDEVRKELFAHSIFTPIHWPVKDARLNGNNLLYEKELSLICDPRYNEDDMMFQIDTLRKAFPKRG